MCQHISAGILGPVVAPFAPDCPAKTLSPQKRRDIALQAMTGHVSISELADQHEVSRKFVTQQAKIAREALDQAFAPQPKTDDNVLFELPVTKPWIRQFVLGLVLICHSSFRGVIELLWDVFHIHISIGTIHNILRDAARKAQQINQQQDLANIDYAGLDEIFQNGLPVLVGVDISSTFCFLLQDVEHRDADTWGVHLLDLKPQKFAPKATIADFGTGLRAGQTLAMSDVPCRGDLFHILADMTKMTTFLDNRAYKAIHAHDQVRQQKAKAKKPKKRKKALKKQGSTLSLKAAAAAEATAIALADDIRLLARWLHHDIFAVSGLDIEYRRELYDFIVEEMQARESQASHRITPLCQLLTRHRDHLLAFAEQLDSDLHNLAEKLDVPVYLVREMLDVESLDEHQHSRWQRDAELHDQLGYRYHELNVAVRELKSQVVRASSVVENLNSRLRPYLFLRRGMGTESLGLLRFFLNHRRFLRSEHPERVDKSPTQLLTGEAHPHWLEMLGHQRFQRN
jgi:hypothetical protein